MTYNAHFTSEAIATLRNLARNSNVRQITGTFGEVDENGRGAVCAVGGLLHFADSYRNMSEESATELMNKHLPITTGEIFNLNDDDHLSFEQIADYIEAEAGGFDAIIL